MNQDLPSSAHDSPRIVYLMRGLPSCGKSTMARQLAGTRGIICETDEFFYTQCGNDPSCYDYDADRLEEAREWNYRRFEAALQQGISPIVLDRGNGLNAESRRFALLAREHGYELELREPNSPWWQELRVLLKFRDFVAPELFDRYAEALAAKSRSTHRVPVETIRRWMRSWRTDITIDDILGENEPPSDGER